METIRLKYEDTPFLNILQCMLIKEQILLSDANGVGEWGGRVGFPSTFMRASHAHLVAEAKRVQTHTLH